MTRYIISDTHFGHSSIIDYCNRPFSDVNGMNRTIVSNWNRTVSEDDTVIHLGDVRHDPSPFSEKEWLDNLNGRILLVEGNHDSVGHNFPYPVVQSCTIQHGRFTFYLEHGPVENSNFWQIHGHIHNNDLRNHPFIDWQNKRVNVSVELIDYTPLKMDELVYYLDRRERITTLEEARDRFGVF